MTYIYTQPKFDSSRKLKNLKLAAIGFSAIAIVCAVLLISAPKSKPTPLATQPTTLELTDSPVESQKLYQNAEGLTYTAIDNSIREAQVDVAHLGHSMKLALISDRNRNNYSCGLCRLHYWHTVLTPAARHRQIGSSPEYWAVQPIRTHRYKRPDTIHALV